MGRVLLVGRLAARDLRRRPVEAALLLLAIMGATTTLTLGLVMHGLTDKPYESTREATAGPDVVASIAENRPGGQTLAGLEALAKAPGVTAHSGPYPVRWATLKAHGHTAPVRVDGRDRAPAPVDRPELTEGIWVRDGGVVIEAAFADALRIDAGDSITLRAVDLNPASGEPVAGRNSRSFRVVGVAVTAATTAYPEVFCLAFCAGNAGLVWLTRADARSLAPQKEPLAYVSYLKLADPATASAFVDEHNRRSDSSGGPARSESEPPMLRAWQEISAESANLVEDQRRVLLTGGWLLGLLAVASVAVLVGGRMADQIRRVGLLKAVGGSPSLVAAVLLAEYVVVALFAAAAGLAIGYLIAPVVTDPSAGLLGRAGAPPLANSTIGLVTAVALGVAVAATFVPAVRAARTSTVLALADSARAPRRTGWLIAISGRLPVPLLLGLRVAARRPRRVVLATASIAITVSGVVAALSAHADLNNDKPSGTASVEDQLTGVASTFDASRTDRLNQVLLVIVITLLALAAVNAIFVTWATALDARHSSALARALGSTPQQVSAGLSAALVLPALAGAILGIPGGIALIEVSDPDSTTTLAPLWQLLAVVPATVLVVAGLTAIPARLGARRSVAEILAAERA
jgi:ABC-type lipoprotein release transport system permease subunit